MGLDWNPLGKPMPGSEEEFERLFQLLTGGPPAARWLERIRRLFRPDDRDDLLRRLHAIQVSPFATLEAPQVGADRRADEWARERYRENPPADKSEAEFLRELDGYFVVALAPACDGIPYYSNGAAGYVEPFSFRAQFVVTDCAEIIGAALQEKCYTSCLAPGLAALGGELRACATAFAAKEGVMRVADLRECDAPEGSSESKAHILFSAARWCEFWSGRGHGLEAYF